MRIQRKRCKEHRRVGEETAKANAISHIWRIQPHIRHYCSIWLYVGVQYPWNARGLRRVAVWIIYEWLFAVALIVRVCLKSTLSWNTPWAKDGKLRTYTEAVNYLLLTYVPDDVISTIDAALTSIAQPQLCRGHKSHNRWWLNRIDAEKFMISKFWRESSLKGISSASITVCDQTGVHIQEKSCTT